MNREMLLFLISLLLGWFYYRRTGWSAGGLVTPGFLVLHRNDPEGVLLLLLLGVLLTFPLEYLVRRFRLFGRERMFAACVLSLGALALYSRGFPLSLHWYGWIIPGLVGAECQRQGIVPTLLSLASVGGASLGAERLLP
ncbi:MAG TPA: poly-gamma-glutamate biosynthesis protein PgsC/CapC [Synergistaceae bacterium]|nr:poly-gamma-glutamate biosynthesis protein PgsC/CapC [Synergistaceae bacterium]HPJ26003.1 poly-gamma-glutamate biosynthesis protein PgsC/CapC [Synergistaceae bacterium]HPQ37311.1 poly-gamma-glutamate biosynthesis protein PgsC/CapC [Synergistaceae bacterium]